MGWASGPFVRHKTGETPVPLGNSEISDRAYRRINDNEGLSMSTSRVALFKMMMCCVTSITLVAPVVADEAQRAFDVLFAGRMLKVTKTADRADDIALAKQMLELTTKAGVDEALIVLLCEHASELTQRHPDGYNVAIEAMEILAAANPQRQAKAQETMADLLTRQLARARGEAQQEVGGKLIKLLLAMSEGQVEQSNFTEAATLSRRAFAAAVRIKSPSLDAVKAQLDSVLHRQRVQKKIAINEERLLKDRTDSTTAEALVLLYVIDLEQPAKALPVLSAVKDAAMKQHVPLTAKPSSDLSANETLSLGEWYRSVGSKLSEPAKSIAYHHAASRFQQYLNHPNASSLGKTKATAFAGDVKHHLEKTGYQPGVQASARPGGRGGINSTGRLTMKGSLVVFSFEKSTIRKKGDVVYLQDLSGNNLHGEIQGAVPVTGQAGDALMFDGKDDQVVIRPLYKALTQGHEALTITVWAKAELPKVYGLVFSIGSQGERGVTISTTTRGQWAGLLPMDLGGRVTYSKSAASTQWQHITLTLGEGKQRLYVNGEVEVENNVPRFALTDKAISYIGKNSKEQAGWDIARIGTQAKKIYRSGRFFKGLIDEFALFTRALSAAEIKAIYEQGKAGKSFGSR